ncbi:MAG TPA: Calx-beta domain-containing protein [Pyrinomonadaceae bacterium]|nr:Calx-beta domain-containing protein [Pyrinomonadaceae bacterium]
MSVAQTAFNGRIAFSSTRNSQGIDVYTVNPDGSSAVRLTDDLGSAANPDLPSYDFDPAWSPDGTKLAFTSNRDGGSFDIYKMNADGSNIQRLTNNPASQGEAAWSPDGTKIAFRRGGGCVILAKPHESRNDDDPCAPLIYVMNADGSNQVKLSTSAGDVGPVWSPDGSKIAFTVSSQTAPFDSSVYVMNADGSNRTRLTNGSEISYVSSWSPDGSKLAFFSNRDTKPDDFYRFQIYLMDADGNNQVRITNNAFDDYYPAFSPDGQQIAFQRQQLSTSDVGGLGGSGEIFVMNVDGSAQTNITHSTAYDFGPPAWQRLSSPPQLTPPAVLKFDGPTYTTFEFVESHTLRVARTGNTNEATTVEYESTDGTALQSSDYIITSGTLSFAPGQTSKTLSILLTDDEFTEAPETLKISLHDVTGNAIIQGTGEATVTIEDDDSVPATINPLEDTQFFVRQHYHDFLNRRPDPFGFAFWVNNIESCGTDQHCREAKRIDTSAAFFLSIEFQQTGFYVYRLNALGLYVPPYYPQFMHDTQQISKDLIVGLPGWPELLEANTQKLTEEFVSRAYFKSNFPASLSAEQYVERLYSRAFVTPPPAERAEAIAAYGSGDAAGRARAIRIVANNAAFKQLTLNQSFVLMQYYGYLRRNPDFEGYNFWFQKLEEFNGDFRAAEMVKAFITSGEYRGRFGLN